VIERTFARRRGAHRLEARRLWRPQGPREPWEQRRQRDNRVAERRGILEEWRNLTDGLIPTGCETFGTVASHQSLEIRYPFLDRRLVEFCLAVPVSQKLQDGWTRAIMRRAMDGILPDSVRWRGGKARLGPNFDRTLLMFGKERAERSLLKEPGILGTYMNLPKVQAIYRHYTADGGRTPYESIWTAITLGTWLAGKEAPSVQ